MPVYNAPRFAPPLPVSPPTPQRSAPTPAMWTPAPYAPPPIRQFVVPQPLPVSPYQVNTNVAMRFLPRAPMLPQLPQIRRLPFVSGLGDDATAPWYASVLDTVADTAKLALPLYQQKELIQLQNDRAAQGLPPLDLSMYTPGVSVGLSSSTQSLVLFVGGAIALAVLLGLTLSGRGK